MKRWFPIAALFCIVAFSACNRRVETRHGTSLPSAASPQLQAIDSVMQQWPDSALALLLDCRDGVHTVSTDPTDRHYYQLLLSEALYKNDSVQRNRKTLQQAMAYFDSLAFTLSDTPHAFWRHCGFDPQSPEHNDNLTFLDARAHYMNGVGYYENDSAVPACKEYMKALDIMQDHFEEKELVGYMAKFMALTYTHLLGLFSDLYLHEQAIYFGKLALEYYQEYNATPWHLAWVLNAIGAQYDMMDNYDSAWLCYEEGIKSLPDTNNITYRDLATRLAYLSYKKDDTKKTALFQIQNLISLSESEKECLSRHLTIGEIFFNETMFDSAWIHLDKVFNEAQSIASKKIAAQRLVEICDSLHQYKESYEYALFLVPFANQDENNGTTKTQLTELYNTFRQKAIKRKHQQVTGKNMRWDTWVMGGLLMVVLIITMLHLKNNKKRMLIEEKPIQVNARKRYELFLNEPLCKDIIQSIQGKNIKRTATPLDYPELILTDAQLQQLAFIFSLYFGSLESLFEQCGLKPNPTLINLCHLYLLGMDEKQAAILLNRDYSSVKRYENRLKTAFHTQENMVTFLRKTILNQ